MNVRVCTLQKIAHDGHRVCIFSFGFTEFWHTKLKTKINFFFYFIDSQ